MTRRLVVLTGVLLVATTGGSVASHVELPDPSALAVHVIALTAPEMEGRASGTVGAERAARYLADQLAAAGLHPGGEGASFLQSFVIGSTARLGAGSSLERLGASPARFEAGRDWVPHGGSRRETVRGELVFAGYGVSASGHNDYAGLDVTGRVVLVLDGVPPSVSGPPPSRLDKLIAARRRGAIALLISGDGLPALESTGAPVNLVSGTLTAATTDVLLAPSGLTRAALVQSVAESRAPAPLPAGVEVAVRVDLQTVEVRTANVVGIVPGHDPTRTAEAVVVGAHYDHLGRSGSAVYPGADDNASGTAVVLELARAFATAGGAPRTLVFVLFSGEEIGLLGSRHYVRSPTVPIERTVAMINLDMVGRRGDRPLGVRGAATGGGLKAVVDDAGRQLGLALADREAPGSASDHARAGMREGDIIVRLGEVSVPSFEALRAALQAQRPGDHIQVVYLRDGEDRTARAVLGERP